MFKCPVNFPDYSRSGGVWAGSPCPLAHPREKGPPSIVTVAVFVLFKTPSFTTKALLPRRRRETHSRVSEEKHLIHKREEQRLLRHEWEQHPCDAQSENINRKTQNRSNRDGQSRAEAGCWSNTAERMEILSQC